MNMLKQVPNCCWPPWSCHLVIHQISNRRVYRAIRKLSSSCCKSIAKLLLLLLWIHFLVCKVSSMMSHHSNLPRYNSPFLDFSFPSELHPQFSEWVKIEGKDQTFGWNAFLLQVIRENFQSAVGSGKSQKHTEWMFWHILELSWGNI